MPIQAPNVIPLCTTTLVPNAIIMFRLILVTAPNAFPDSYFINHLYVYAMIERSSSRDGSKTQKRYLLFPCLTLTIIRYVSIVRWGKPERGVATYPLQRCSSYWPGNIQLPLDYSHQLYKYIYIYIYIYIIKMLCLYIYIYIYEHNILHIYIYIYNT